MTFMERSHGWYKAERARQNGEKCTGVCNRACDLHRHTFSLNARYPQHGAPNYERYADWQWGIPDDRLAVEFSPVTTLEISKKNGAFIYANPGMLSRDVTVERDARFRNGIVAADSNLTVERPRLAIERAAQNLEQVHGWQAFEEPVRRLLVSPRLSRRTSIHNANKSPRPDDYS